MASLAEFVVSSRAGTLRHTTGVVDNATPGCSATSAPSLHSKRAQPCAAAVQGTQLSGAPDAIPQRSLHTACADDAWISQPMSVRIALGFSPTVRAAGLRALQAVANAR